MVRKSLWHYILAIPMTLSLIGCTRCAGSSEQAPQTPVAAAFSPAALPIDTPPPSLPPVIESQSGVPTPAETVKTPPAKDQIQEVTKLVTKDLKLGKGTLAESGRRVTIHYVGSLVNGRTFDDSRARDAPLTFTLGQHEKLKGWDEGIPGMKVGGKRLLIVPSDLGYGKDGIKGVVPGDATLRFEIELMAVE